MRMFYVFGSGLFVVVVFVRLLWFIASYIRLLLHKQRCWSVFFYTRFNIFFASTWQQQWKKNKLRCFVQCFIIFFFRSFGFHAVFCCKKKINDTKMMERNDRNESKIMINSKKLAPGTDNSYYYTYFFFFI